MTIVTDTPFTCLGLSKIQFSQTGPTISCKFMFCHDSRGFILFTAGNVEVVLRSAGCSYCI